MKRILACCIVGATLLAAASVAFAATIQGTSANEWEGHPAPLPSDCGTSDTGASLKGTTNADRIYGRDGCDYIVARGGKDYVEGNQQMDQIYGGSGPDNLIGGPGHDHVWGDDGNDTINTADGDEEGANIEEVHGGGGRDVCTVDDEAPAGPGGEEVSGCEKLTRQPL